MLGQRTATLSCDVLATSPLLLATLPAATAAIACSGPEVPSGVLLPQRVQLLPPYGTPSFDATITCNLTGSDGAAMGTAALEVVVVATLWPTFDDVLVISSNGFSRSVAGLGPGKMNSTKELLDALDILQGPRRLSRARFFGSTGDTQLSSAIASSAASLAAMERAWGGIALSTGSARPFSLTLFGATPVVLRSRTRSFVNGTTVFLGAARCNDTVVSSDGAWLATIAPDPAHLCGGAAVGGSCNYVDLVVANPTTVALPSGPALGTTLNCPPFCSGAVGDGVFPLASSRASFAPAVLDSTGTVALPINLASVVPGVARPQVVAIAASAGLFYSEACSSTGIYTDPSSGACTNASDPASGLCAFGGGDACRPCPSGALCPGGYRAWPQQGHWSAAESSAAVLQCVQPGARIKCLGWSATLGATKCGVGYLQGSFLCSACSPAFYLAGDGSCAACPTLPTSWDKFSGLFTVISAVVGFGVVVYLVLFSAIVAAGLSTKSIVKVGCACLPSILVERTRPPFRISMLAPLERHFAGCAVAYDRPGAHAKA